MLVEAQDEGRELGAPRELGLLLPGLRRERRARGVTQRTLGRASGLSRACISNLETGARRAGPGTLGRLVMAMGVTKEELTSRGEGACAGLGTEGSRVIPLDGRRGQLGREASDGSVRAAASGAGVTAWGRVLELAGERAAREGTGREEALGRMMVDYEALRQALA